jgi:hypothetical protein
MDVSLAYDPFASADQMRVERSGAAFAVVANEGTRNPARVNFVPLSPGLPRALAPGDVLTVGRSHLVLQP